MDANDTTPNDGAAIDLTCMTTTTGISIYEFKRGTTLVAKTSSATYTIPSAIIGSHNGDYTCIAYIDTVASDPSNIHGVACELFEKFTQFVICIRFNCNFLMKHGIK